MANAYYLKRKKNGREEEQECYMRETGWTYLFCIYITPLNPLRTYTCVEKKKSINMNNLERITEQEFKEQLTRYFKMQLEHVIVNILF